MLGGHRASGSASLSCQGRHWFPKDSRRHFITCKFCQPSKLFLLMPLSDEQRRRPSCCCQRQVGPRRSGISSSRYLEPGRTRKQPPAAPDRQFWPVQPRRRMRRMREQRPSLGELSSWCLPVVVRPVLDREQIESADEGSLGVAPGSLLFLKMSNIDQQPRNSGAHAGSITAPPSATIGDRELVMLPPNAGKQSDLIPTRLDLTAIERPRCSRCQTRMMLERVSLRPIGFEHRLFECPKCNHVETRVIASDPFKSMVTGWFAGELRAPN